MHKILIVDDDARMRRMVRQVVEHLASRIHEAADGLEAVAVCAAEHPDWVLMDWRMKPMDGLCATVEITARYPGTRVVLVSQYDDPRLHAAALRAGACACVLKENLSQVPAIILGSSPTEKQNVSQVGVRDPAGLIGDDRSAEPCLEDSNPRPISETK